MPAAPTIAFLEDEIVNKKADVEIVIVWNAGNGLAGHCVHVIGYSIEQGVSRITWVHDRTQRGDLERRTSDLVSFNNNTFFGLRDFINGTTAVVANIPAEELVLPPP